GARRAQPHRPHLAARLGRARDHRDHHAGPHQSHAGAQGPALGGQDPPADRVRAVAVAAGEMKNDMKLAELSLYEVRRKIYPRAVHGWFAAWRWALVWATQIVFYC